ncbi:hypothetical protein CLOP_g4982 [Closterium sp. NIES-67]|nr:hypothetical protein CLOP_g4982 [Closterium sp. NIES-67]
MMASRRLPVILLAAIALCSLLSPAACSANPSTAFCQSLVAKPRATCSAISAVAGFDLMGLQGRWYGVASSAQQQFSTELGTSCIAYDFNPVSQPGSSSQRLRLTSRGLQAASPIQSAQVATIAATCASIARLLASLCSAAAAPNLPSGTSLFDLLRRAQAAFGSSSSSSSSSSTTTTTTTTTSISSSSSSSSGPLLPQKLAGVTSSRLSTMSASLNRISLQAAAIQSTLERILAVLGQANGEASLPNARELRSQLVDLTTSLQNAAGGIQGERKQLWTAARALWTSLAASVPGARSHGAVNTMIRAGMAMERHASPVGPVASLASRIATLARLSAAPISALDREALEVPRRTSSTGDILNTDAKGGVFYVAYRSHPSVEYSVVYADSSTSQGNTDVVVLHTCQSHCKSIASGSCGQSRYIVLSRQPSIDTHILDNVSEGLKDRGIHLEGVNLLLPTNQNPRGCSDSWGLRQGLGDVSFTSNKV